MARSEPDFELADGTRLNEHLRAGRGLLLEFEGRTSFQALAGRCGDRIRYVANSAKERLGVSALLVRPDGFVAWAGDLAASEGDAARAVSRWFGGH